MIIGRENCDFKIGVADWSQFTNLKKPVLYIEKSNEQFKVASFNNEESAMLFLQALEEMLMVKLKEVEE